MNSSSSSVFMMFLELFLKVSEFLAMRVWSLGKSDIISVSSTKVLHEGVTLRSSLLLKLLLLNSI